MEREKGNTFMAAARSGGRESLMETENHGKNTPTAERNGNRSWSWLNKCVIANFANGRSTKTVSKNRRHRSNEAVWRQLIRFGRFDSVFLRTLFKGINLGSLSTITSKDLRLLLFFFFFFFLLRDLREAACTYLKPGGKHNIYFYFSCQPKSKIFI